jgi:PadR family transcriptional regulator, regulatory protein PadR
MDGCRLSTGMPEAEAYQNKIEVLQGTLDMIILQTLGSGERHGYGIVQLIRARSSDVLQVETGSLYPALHRLEKRGWIHSEWKSTENSQRARYYRLTAAGRKQLEVEHDRWTRYTAAIACVMNPQSNEG